MQAIASTDFDVWQETVRTVCGPLDATPTAAAPFSGSVGVRRVANVPLLEHCAKVDQLHWDRRHIAEIQSPFCYIILQLSRQRLMIEQDNKDVTLGQGDWTVIDSLRPAAFRFEDGFNILAVNLPRELVAGRAYSQDLPLATRMSGTTGASAVFSTFARSLYDHAPSLHPDDTRHRDNVLDLLFATLPGAFDLKDRHRERQLERAQRVIDGNLANTSLSPQFIADAVGISTRHLHRLFAENGQALGDWIRQRRLERARCDLADPRFGGNSILDIAFSCGFSDSAHFSRAFRAAFGIPPRDYRRRVLGRG